MSFAPFSPVIRLPSRQRGPDAPPRRPRAAKAALAVVGVAIVSMAVAAVASVATAEELRRSEVFRYWSVFVDDEAPDISCYAATAPTDTTSSLPIRRRGDPLLLVSTFPEDNVRNELSVNLGYQPRPDRPTVLKIGGATFNLIIDGEHAFLESPDENGAVMAALRRGRVAVVEATSRRGNEIEDTYSLIGFTAATERVNAICSQ